MYWRLFLTLLIASTMTLSGCGSSTSGKYSKAELERLVAERCMLKEVKLEAKGDGKFTGTGVDKDGRPFKVEATLESNRVSWNATLDKPESSGAVATMSGSEFW